jgi:hypothetical protein
VRNDGQLYDYVQALKDRHLRKSVPLGKVLYDGKLQVMKHALGTHTTIYRVHGGRLKASREIRIASVFRDAPAEFLKMIVVHELAHMKEAEHDKAFYQLCTHMAPDYHQLEFDLRLYLTTWKRPGRDERAPPPGRIEPACLRARSWLRCPDAAVAWARRLPRPAVPCPTSPHRRRAPAGNIIPHRHRRHQAHGEEGEGEVDRPRRADR